MTEVPPPEPSKPAPTSATKGCLWLFVGVFALILVFAVSCSVSGSDSDSSVATSSAPVDSKYTQTWTKSYASTSCDEWNDEMSSAQQWTAAGDMLVAMRKTESKSGLPADAIITAFRKDITDGCGSGVASIMVADVAAFCFVADHDIFGY